MLTGRKETGLPPPPIRSRPPVYTVDFRATRERNFQSPISLRLIVRSLATDGCAAASGC
jgi:hypothetical protein